MIPDEGYSDKPVGSDPEVIENDNLSPVIKGVIENGLFFDRT